MFQELKFQLSTAILTILTLATGVVAVINFQQQHKFRLHDDGVIWVDRAGGVEALEVLSESARTAGVHKGDVLMSISRQDVRQAGQESVDPHTAHGVPVGAALDVAKILYNLPSWLPAVYHVKRGNLEFDIRNVLVAEVPLDRAVVYEYVVGVGYLIIGLFVYFRRGSAQKALHFYIFCLASFAFFCFHYTGQLNALDKIVYFGNVAAGLLAPALFLHFCLTFPEPFNWFRTTPRLALLYLPASLLFLAFLGFASGALKIGIPLIELRWMLDRIWVPFSTVPYLVGAVALTVGHRNAEDPIVRQQLKWLRNGTFFGILPFFLLYVLPYVLGVIPNDYLKLSVFSVVLIPLTLAYAIVRYRLMDVDIIFRRGYAYTLATLCVLGAFYGIVFSLGSMVHLYFKDLGNLELISVMLIASFLFQPIRTWIQERLDKYFYRDLYDYRRTLIEFARELSAETDLDTMLHSVGERLLQTLSIKHLVFFLADEPAGESAPHFRLKKAMGANPRLAGVNYDDLDLSFLNWQLPEGYLFFERTRHQLDAVSRSWPATVRRTIADLDLNYYLPCPVRGRTIAYMGVSRTTFGDYLSSVDVELLVTLAGYVGIAIENATLYRSLQRKVEEYERLKEFSENIVESINVGILAADLEDRVESWNTQIEQLSGVPRDRALGRTLRELFPADLIDQFDKVQGQTGIHHIYKFVLKPAGSGAAGHVNGNGNGHATLPGRIREATLNIAIAPLVSKEQEQIGRLIIFDDVTDRAELEQRLVQADKLSSIGLLAAGVAHEVNTPLAVISTYAQMLAKQVAEDSQKSLILDKIAKQTFRASEIVNSLLNFSRTSTSSFGDLPLNKVIQETLSLLEHQLQKAGIATRVELASDLPAVHGNAGKLQQVFLNLFLNARDAMPGGGRLEVRSWHEGQGVRVEVSDTGTGIAPEHLQRIYDPFFTTKAARKGTGLGLSVTYGIIQEHGGSIEVSNQPGGGARFHIELPVSRAADSARGARQPVNAA
ncbi:PAS/PAC sensor signal transduction histidine kinase [Candidatus Sulfopaludibacter sp. SbA3]|nr:PAS/PAC sensor signal transduction histidine kinase [Candidatus Sulfopaludibacter sp. SbA3]